MATLRGAGPGFRPPNRPEDCALLDKIVKNVSRHGCAEWMGFCWDFRTGKGYGEGTSGTGMGLPGQAVRRNPETGQGDGSLGHTGGVGARSIPVSRLSAPERSEAVRGGRVRRPPDQNRSSGHAGLYRSSATRRAAEVNTVAINARVTIPRVVSARALCHVRGQHGSD